LHRSLYHIPECTRPQVTDYRPLLGILNFRRDSFVAWNIFSVALVARKESALKIRNLVHVLGGLVSDRSRTCNDTYIQQLMATCVNSCVGNIRIKTKDPNNASMHKRASSLQLADHKPLHKIWTFKLNGPKMMRSCVGLIAKLPNSCRLPSEVFKRCRVSRNRPMIYLYPFISKQKLPKRCSCYPKLTVRLYLCSRRVG
jgi:hypothetical protein